MKKKPYFKCFIGEEEDVNRAIFEIDEQHDYTIFFFKQCIECLKSGWQCILTIQNIIFLFLNKK